MTFLEFWEGSNEIHQNCDIMVQLTSTLMAVDEAFAGLKELACEKDEMSNDI